MSQSKRMSLIEACVNTGIGLVTAFAVNGALMYLTGVSATATQNALIVAGHTVVSVVRSYLVRRYFNKKDTKDTDGRAHTPPASGVGQVGHAQYAQPSSVTGKGVSGCAQCALRIRFDEEAG